MHVYSRSLRYRNKTVRLPDGTEYTFLAGEEKGIDVRIALDVIRMAHRNEFDVARVLSQDQDLSEVAAEIRVIAREQNRWIKIAFELRRRLNVKVGRIGALEDLVHVGCGAPKSTMIPLPITWFTVSRRLSGGQ